MATIDDTADENNETVRLNLSNASGGATIPDSQGTGTIVDNDTAGTCNGVSFAVANNPTVKEGVTAVFTITKAGSTSSSCSVNYATADGSDDRDEGL